MGLGGFAMGILGVYVSTSERPGKLDCVFILFTDDKSACCSGGMGSSNDGAFFVQNFCAQFPCHQANVDHPNATCLYFHHAGPSIRYLGSSPAGEELVATIPNESFDYSAYPILSYRCS